MERSADRGSAQRRRRQKVGHPALIQIALNCNVWRGANRAEHPQNALVFNQTADLLHRLWRAIGVVYVQEVYLAAIYAASVIQGLVVSDCASPNNPYQRGGTAVRRRPRMNEPYQAVLPLI
jgi:hypothetical protein